MLNVFDFNKLPPNPSLNYIGVALLLGGFLLILSGLNIVKVEKVTVTPGRKTYISGIVLVILGVGFLLPNILESLPQSDETTKLKDFVRNCWFASQNDGDFEKYKSCFSPDFKGIRRTSKDSNRVETKKMENLEQWLKDRENMFNRALEGHRMYVSMDRTKVFSTSDNADYSIYRIIFYQRWGQNKRKGPYCDYGEKVLKIRQITRQPESFKIFYEEMRNSSERSMSFCTASQNFDWPE